MLRRIRSRITPSGVIATIALFAALGGGYATAFSGSGTLQKAGQNTVRATFQDLRTLKGFGTLRVRCDLGDDEFEYQIKNASSAIVNWSAERPDGGYDRSTVFPGGTETIGIGSGADDGVIRIHLWKPNLNNKDQVDIVASNAGPDPVCGSGALVRVMALNTVE